VPETALTDEELEEETAGILTEPVEEDELRTDAEEERVDPEVEGVTERVTAEPEDDVRVAEVPTEPDLETELELMEAEEEREVEDVAAALEEALRAIVADLVGAEEEVLAPEADVVLDTILEPEAPPEAYEPEVLGLMRLVVPPVKELFPLFI